jgi:GNAT superfamily N-acetyltransferase
MDPMKARIRRAEPSDAQHVQVLLQHLTGNALERQAAEDRLRMIDASPSDELYLMEDDNGVQGLLGFRIRENVEEVSRYGEVSVLVTRPEARMSGYGRALMEFAEQLAKDRGCKGTWLVSGFGREEDAHKFYAKLGYQVTEYRFVKPF